LESFNGGNNEAYPETTLLLSGNTLYGGSGGPGAQSTLFVINTNGTGFRTLYTFTPISGPHYTNSDGCVVAGTLSLSGNTLYGASDIGGSGGNGTVFAVNTNGTGITILHGFTVTAANSSGVQTNSDGSSPGAGLVLSGNTLYGTANSGGSSGSGTVFAVNPTSPSFTNLHSFTATPPYPNLTNSDGANPQCG
jgi:uncharacterized repeat protein (TIGR03803 family)